MLYKPFRYPEKRYEPIVHDKHVILFSKFFLRHTNTSLLGRGFPLPLEKEQRGSRWSEAASFRWQKIIESRQGWRGKIVGLLTAQGGRYNG
jgi:hypothetical protein